MRAITKGPEPALLRAYRAVPGATYDGKDFTPVKEEIRAALLRDQHALCSYCMRRISGDARPHPANPEVPALVQMKVEHWRSQQGSPALQLAWTNLLGACLGGMGSPPADQTCDTRKGEDEIQLDPLNAMHISTLYCRTSGRLESTHPAFQTDIDEHLGLNHRVLIADRRSLLDRFVKRLKLRYPASPIPESAVGQMIAELETPSGGKLPMMCGVLRLWARKRYGARW